MLCFDNRMIITGWTVEARTGGPTPMSPAGTSTSGPMWRQSSFMKLWQKRMISVSLRPLGLKSLPPLPPAATELGQHVKLSTNMYDCCVTAPPCIENAAALAACCHTAWSPGRVLSKTKHDPDVTVHMCPCDV